MELSWRHLSNPMKGELCHNERPFIQKDAISLGVGEPDFDTPWHIRDEGIYSLEKGRTFYTSNAGLKELKVEIARYLDRRYGMTYDYNKEIMVTVGGSEAIDIALRAMLDAGDEVIIPQADDKNYHSEIDRSMLYVAVTRAMHRLTLTYSGRKHTLFI